MAISELARQIEQLAAIRDIDADRFTKAQRAVDLIRSLGRYRWVGLYDVLTSEIAVIAWSGPEPPAHPRFSIAEGLDGACVSSREPVIAQDVAVDSRYLATIGGTRGEMIQPVLDESGAVIGTIDAESDRVNAFGSADRQLLGTCAKNLSWLWRTNERRRGCS